VIPQRLTKRNSRGEKVATKKPVKPITMQPVQTVYILSNGDALPSPVYLDPNGVKHPPKIYFQAMDLTTSYQIVLDVPPMPFKNPPDPIVTNGFGQTPTLKVDPKYANGRYGYEIVESPARGKIRILSAGGIIVDA
jgi:hypothetical protein